MPHVSPHTAHASPLPVARAEARPFRPTLPEVVLVVLLAALVGLLLLPNVVVVPYRDPLAEEPPETLRQRLADPDLPAALRVRALDALAAARGTEAAVVAALAAVRTPRQAAAEDGQALLAWVADRPVPGAAGEVLQAWQHGRLPDATWRERFLPAGWADAAAWVAVPLLAATEPDARRMLWIADVLGHAQEREYAAPVFGTGGGDDNGGAEPGGEPPPAADVRYRTGAQVLLTYVQDYLARTPPRNMRPVLELRLLENLARTPGYLATEAAQVAVTVVASRRLPANEAAAEAVSREAYATAVLDLAEATMPAERFAAWLADVAADAEQAEAYAPFAQARLAE